MRKILKKLITAGFIAIILVGLFSSPAKTQAQTGSPTKGTCTITDTSERPPIVSNVPNQTFDQCTGLKPTTGNVAWAADGGGATVNAAPAGPTGTCTTVDTRDTVDKTQYPTGATTVAKTTQADCTKMNQPGLVATWTADATDSTSNMFKQCSLDGNFSIDKCTVYVLYIIFYELPAYILWLTAYIFNASIPLTIGTVLYHNNFLPEAWRIVRDFSNIFFILVLLYVAIKMILGFGGGEVKKMVVNVVIAALLINFSMFMTEVVIDSSNILALIFYNKITVNPAQTSTESDTPYYPTLNKDKTAIEEKDIAGGIVKGFDITKFLSPDSVTLQVGDKPAGSAMATAKNTATGTVIGSIFGPLGGVAGGAIGYLFSASASGNQTGLQVAIIFTACAVFLMASWAFLIAGFAFLGRLIELWILIIFSPFALMSFSVPRLKSIKFLGWDAWLERLMHTAFMAPIFMFFLLLISKLVQIDILGGLTNTDKPPSIAHALLILAIPAIIYLTMLYKATEYAKKNAGEFGAAVVKYGEMAAVAVGGLALGAASGGTSMAATATIGRAGAAAANSGWAKKWESKGWGGEYFRRAATAVGSSSFDVRGIKIGGKALGTTIGAGEGRKDGFTERRKKQVENRQKRAKDLEVGEDEPLKQKLNNSENDLQQMMNKVARDFEIIDKDLEGQRQKKNDAVVGSIEEATASREIERLNNIKRDINDGKAFNYVDSAGGIHNVSSTTVIGGDNNGKTIKQMQREVIPEQKNDVTKENRARKWTYADTTRSKFGQAKSFVFSGGTHSFAGAHEAAHAIIMEAKLPDNVAK
ncbi:MAG: hypothetical protein KGL67_00505 [Patescibacteria group bacterium]|nr:hypothetical protein [Patescibacteria group bacterium]